jgi:hypothetical protein
MLYFPFVDNFALLSVVFFFVIWVCIFLVLILYF